MKRLRSVVGGSFCVWKGVASYYDIVVGERVVKRATWTYEAARAAAGVGLLRRLDHDEIVGPFGGAPGAEGW